MRSERRTTPTSTELLLTVEDLAVEWRVKPRTIRDLCARGEIPFIRLPGDRLIRFRRAELDELLDSRRMGPRQ